jgi:lipid-A-disaccharide synthase
MDPGINFTLPIAAPEYQDFIRDELKTRKMENLVLFDNGPEAMAVSDFVLVASGTAALEASLFEIPHIIFYRLSRFTVSTVRLLQRFRIIRHNCIGLPNLLLGKEVVPELYQSEVNPRNLADETWRIFQDRELYFKMVEELKGIRQLLGSEDTLVKSAEIVLKRVEEGS